tara:strand:- start:219 stop:782 length:564 start_codon:yes stop_codon:yes gene_type:complete
MTSSERGEGSVVDPNVYLADCFRLARKIWDDGYRPEFLVAVWRGGAQPAIVIQELFRWRGHNAYHTAVQKQYRKDSVPGGSIDIKGIDHVLDVMETNDQLLVVDNVFDNGRDIYEVVNCLQRKARRNIPQVRVATVYFQPARQLFGPGPDYYLHEGEDPLLLPDRLSNISKEETLLLYPELHGLLYG